MRLVENHVKCTNNVYVFFTLLNWFQNVKHVPCEHRTHEHPSLIRINCFLHFDIPAKAPCLEHYYKRIMAILVKRSSVQNNWEGGRRKMGNKKEQITKCWAFQIFYSFNCFHVSMIPFTLSPPLQIWKP